MKSFKFEYGDNYEVAYSDGDVEITEHDEWGNWSGSVTLPMPALLGIHAEAKRLYPIHNPSCNEVSKARTQLENARDKRTVAANGNGFEEALKAYIDISEKHKAAFDCQIFH